MGHHLQALIGKAPINDNKARELALAVAYENGFVIVILFDESLYYWERKLNKNMNQLSELLEFDCELTHYIAELLGMKHYAIIQTDYFAGLGEQYAGFYIEGEKIMEGYSINEALELLGVKSNPDCDEFDTINLGEYRNCEAYYWDATYNLALGNVNMIPGKVLKDC